MFGSFYSGFLVLGNSIYLLETTSYNPGDIPATGNYTASEQAQGTYIAQSSQLPGAYTDVEYSSGAYGSSGIDATGSYGVE